MKHPFSLIGPKPLSQHIKQPRAKLVKKEQENGECGGVRRVTSCLNRAPWCCIPQHAHLLKSIRHAGYKWPLGRVHLRSWGERLSGKAPCPPQSQLRLTGIVLCGSFLQWRRLALVTWGQELSHSEGQEDRSVFMPLLGWGSCWGYLLSSLLYCFSFRSSFL